jgi:hypothetical protein
MPSSGVKNTRKHKHQLNKFFTASLTIIWILFDFLIIKPTRCTNFSNLFWEWNSTCFGQFLCPSSGAIHCTHSNGICHTGSGWNCSSILILLLLDSCLQTCMTYTIAECTVNNSWWWAEELSETCRASFQNKFEKLVHLVGFIIRKFVTMHGHVNVKFIRFVLQDNSHPQSFC